MFKLYGLSLYYVTLLLAVVLYQFPVIPIVAHAPRVDVFVAPQPTYNISFFVSRYYPVNFSIKFNGTAYRNGQSGLYSVGNYTAVAPAYEDWGGDVGSMPFDHWDTSGGVHALKPNSYVTSVNVTNSGNLTAVYPVPGPVTPTALLISTLTLSIFVIIIKPQMKRRDNKPRTVEGPE